MKKIDQIKFYSVVVFSLALSAFGFIYGLKLADRIWPVDDRTPASASADDSLDNLNYKKLFETVVVFKSLEAQGVELGAHYIGSQFVCEVYSQLQLHFKAEGMAVSGEIPKMVLTGPCLKNNSKDKIEALLINANKILETTPKDKKMTSIQNTIHLEFSDLSDSWPPTWLLTEIRFLKSTAANVKEDLVITHTDIRNANITIQLDW